MPSIREITLPRTNNTLGKRLVLECGKTEITDLNRSCRTSDKDIVALEVTVDHWRSPTVKEQQTFEDL